ncbi:MAG: hypothetical protein K9G76_10610 [Bacteroidales bacterium]|nr:hypothetical protein [Bacteroidales bacterium]MCF8404220.1 hypothetical protein [Bacteroidales bacterium]
MIKKFLLPGIFVCFSLGIIAQDTQRPSKNASDGVPLRDKIYFGGGLGATFGSYTRIAVYPLIGIRVTDDFRTGMQLAYEYINDKRYYINYDGSNYGLGIFAQYNVLPQLFFHLEPAIWNYNGYYLFDQNDRVWVPYFFVGAGLSQQIGRNSIAYIQVKFDIIQHEKSPYSSWAPLFDVGVGIGL